MKISHEDYLKQMLASKKSELDYIVLEHRIAIAEYNVRKEMLFKQINSIETQLEKQ